VICTPIEAPASSVISSGKIACVCNPILRLAFGSKLLGFNQTKSLTLGRTIVVSLFKNSRALSLLRVTLNITGISSLNLKFEIAFLDLRRVGF
jgi:hypothetical protein